MSHLPFFHRATLTTSAAMITVGGAAATLDTWAVVLVAIALTAATAWQAHTMSIRLRATARRAHALAGPVTDGGSMASPKGDVRPPGDLDGLGHAIDRLAARTDELIVAHADQRRDRSESLHNLGQRVKGLANLQLERIAELELANPDGDLDALHRLDHLATRIRRNAQSLIVLADTDDLRHRIQTGNPIAVLDVLAAATAEVEQFDRMSCRAVQPVKVSGRASGDLAHLLAELTENALAFSPPSTTVEVIGLRGTTGDYRIYLSDRGIGMTDAALVAANDTLAGRSDATTSSRFLGHLVIGRLARRHDISVAIASNGTGGITATVTIPAALITATKAFNHQAGSLALAPSSYGDIAANRRSFDDQVRNAEAA